LRRLRLVPQRPERDGDLDRPASVESGRAHVPDGVPVAAWVAAIVDEEINHRASRRRREDAPVSPVVERVQKDAEIVVLTDQGIARELTDPFRRTGGIPAPRGDIDVAVVEQYSHVGQFRRAGTLLRHLLDEFAE
jgi:hypothetical protein